MADLRGCKSGLKNWCGFFLIKCKINTLKRNLNKTPLDYCFILFSTIEHAIQMTIQHAVLLDLLYTINLMTAK